MGYFFAAAFIIFVIVAFGYMFWSAITSLLHIFHYATRYRVKHFFYKTFTRRGLSSEDREILRNYFTFYRNLSAENKWLFERRVKTFMDMKEFVVRTDAIVLTREMKILISACAIQLSFGYPGIFYRNFFRILIYPDDYYSTINRRYHQGEVNPKGYIVLSWKNFLVGYADEKDGRNLGLHEMAHALLLEDSIMNGEYEFLDHSAYSQWEHLSKHELMLIKAKQSIFSDYAGTNIHELFAEAIEIYFEQPEKLYAYSVNWYLTISTLLNQDLLSLKSRLQ